MKQITVCILLIMYLKYGNSNPIIVNSINSIEQNKNGTCVPRHLCKSYDPHITIDYAIRSAGFVPEQPCFKVGTIFCLSENIQPIEIKAEPLKCGVRNTAGVAVRSQIERTEFGEYPWTVGIFDSKQKAVQPFCTGALIHEQVVLTAAHCLGKHSAEQLAVRAGLWNLQKDSKVFPPQERRAAQIVVFPNYQADNYHTNDVALIFVDFSFEIGNMINVACLPHDRMQYENEECVQSGWGTKSDAFTTMIDIEMVEMRSNKCNEVFKALYLKNFEMQPCFVCGKSKSNSKVRNVGGGNPLVCPITGTDDQYVLTGIASWGITKHKQLPIVYTNVHMFVPWIREQINKYFEDK